MKTPRIFLVLSLALITAMPLAHAFRDQAQQDVIDKAQTSKRNANALPASDAQAGLTDKPGPNALPASDAQASLTMKKVRAGHP